MFFAATASGARTAVIGAGQAVFGVFAQTITAASSRTTAATELFHFVNAY